MRIYSLPELIERNGLNSTAGAFVYPGESALLSQDVHDNDNTDEADSELVPLTTYVIADLDSEKGREFVKEAIKSVVSAPSSPILSSGIDSGLADCRFPQPSVVHTLAFVSDPDPLRPFFHPLPAHHRGRPLHYLC